MSQQRYWIVVASREHVQRGIEAGICQACHGKAAPLKRMRVGDGVIYYSSKEFFGEAEPCQKFTAIGRVRDCDVYSFDMGGGFVPFRRNVDFVPAVDAPIRPLINALTFITDKQRWGGVFRFGMLEIPVHDFQTIATAMQAQLAAVAVE